MMVRSRKKLLFIVLLWFCPAVAIAAFSAYKLDVPLYASLYWDGTQTSATVINVREDGKTIDYEYRIDGDAYPGTFRATMPGAVVGNKLPVTFDAENPSVHRLGDPRENLRGSAAGWIIVNFISSVLLLIGAIWVTRQVFGQAESVNQF